MVTFLHFQGYENIWLSKSSQQYFVLHETVTNKSHWKNKLTGSNLKMFEREEKHDGRWHYTTDCPADLFNSYLTPCFPIGLNMNVHLKASLWKTTESSYNETFFRLTSREQKHGTYSCFTPRDWCRRKWSSLEEAGGNKGNSSCSFRKDQHEWSVDPNRMILNPVAG